tara:strand:- start:1852 stop:2700 length:849 start_codon:yes stop_codon:yes gene_type:complete
LTYHEKPLYKTNTNTGVTQRIETGIKPGKPEKIMIERTLRTLFNLTAPPAMIWEPIVYGPLDLRRPDFMTHVRKAIHKIPAELQASFREAGYTAGITESIKSYCAQTSTHKFEDIAPTASAFFSPLHKIALIPQKTNKPPSAVQAFQNNPARITAHEIGHAAADFIKSSLSEPLYDTEFKNAVDKEIKNAAQNGNAFDALTWHDQVAILNTRNDILYSELFAELFAEIITKNDRVSQYFPSTRTLIEEKINKAVTAYRTANPNFNPVTYPKMEIAAVEYLHI